MSDLSKGRRLLTLLLVCALFFSTTYAEDPLINDVTCKTDDKGQSYVGKVSITESGAPCQNWAAQTPNSHTIGITDDEFPGDETVESAVNYCRNPDGAQHGPWCYVDSTKTRWQYCAIRKCITKVCRSEADIVFVLDSSGSIGTKNYEKLKQFVRGIMDSFKFGPDLIRVALISFSEAVKRDIGFSDSKDDVLDALHNMAYMGKTTYTDKALVETRRLMKTARSNIPHIAIVVTDGSSTDGALTAQQAKRNHNLRNKITTFSVGIGGGEELTDELKLIASSPSQTYVYRVENFEGLETIKNKMAQYACPEEECLCTGSGDPHYKTCDGRWIHFMGKCKYVLAKTCTDNGLPYFEVRAENMVCNDKGQKITPTCTKAVEVIVYDRLVRIESDGKFSVDGEYEEFPFTHSLGLDSKKFFTVDKDAQERTRVITDNGLVVTFKKMRVEVHIPGKYQNQICGLCGNYDGIVENDMVTRENVDVSHLSSVHQQYAEVGESWLVGDPDSPMEECRPLPSGTPEDLEAAAIKMADRVKEAEESDKVTCPDDVMEKAKSNNYCGVFTMMKGPFDACFEANSDIKEQAKTEYQNCIFDMCGMKDNLETAKVGSSCESLENLAKKCEKAGVVVSWRAAANCPLDCPALLAHSVYKEKMSGCPATCADLDPKCGDPDQEGCECETGYVREGDACVPKNSCGCYSMDGKYFKVGETRLTKDCVYSRQCSKGDSPVERILCETKAQKCEGNYACVVKDGVRGCYPQKVVLQGGDKVPPKDKNKLVITPEAAPAKMILPKEAERLKIDDARERRRRQNVQKAKDKQAKRQKAAKARNAKRQLEKKKKLKARRQRAQKLKRERALRAKKAKGGEVAPAPMKMLPARSKGSGSKKSKSQLEKKKKRQRAQKLKRERTLRAKKAEGGEVAPAPMEMLPTRSKGSSSKRSKSKSKKKSSSKGKELPPAPMIQQEQGKQCKRRNNYFMVVPKSDCREFQVKKRVFKCPPKRKFDMKKCKCVPEASVQCTV